MPGVEFLAEAHSKWQDACEKQASAFQNSLNSAVLVRGELLIARAMQTDSVTTPQRGKRGDLDILPARWPSKEQSHPNPDIFLRELHVWVK